MIPGFKNILLIQLGDIGDVVLTTPTIRAAKETYSNAHVSILVRKPYGSLLAADPNIYEVVEFEKIHGNSRQVFREYINFVRRLRQARYDMVINLRTGDRGAIFTFLTGAPLRIGLERKIKQFWHELLYTKIIPDRLRIIPLHVHPGADQSLSIVREIGISTTDSIPKLYTTSEDQVRAKNILFIAGVVSGSSMVTVNPYSRWKYKEWSNEKWGIVIDQIWEAYKLPAVLIGSPQEAEACQEIVAGREGRTFSLAGKTTLGELAAVISMSRLHLGVDSAAPHIAAALGTRTVTIHGPTDWRAWRVANERHKIVSMVMDCLPCNMMGCDGRGRSKCLEELGTEPVVRAAFELLK